MGELLRAPFAAASTAPKGSQKHRQRRAGRRQQRGHDPSVERERLWRLLWSSCPGIGWQRLERLEAMFGSLELAWGASAANLIHGLSGHTRLHQRELEALERYRSSHGPAPISEPPSAEQRQRWATPACLLPSDLTYPEAMLQLERPPLQLFWRGQGSRWSALSQSQAVAVVGTRRPSRHGLTMARQIGRALAEAGWPVVSGLAEGIDAAAHQGCLEAGGCPVGVLGTPLNRVYPRHHGQLQATVAEQGVLVSELPAGTPGRAGHFALRNRLQVGLAQALVLVECPANSGALHSAELAWELGMPIWVVPADAGRISAAGSNRWLQQGATPLLNPSDLTTSLGAGPLRPPRSSTAAPAAAPLLQREAALLAALGAGASLDQLCERLRLAPGVISERLLRLELAGVLRSEPGLWWRPC
jgi:DNA processing protein